MRQRTIVRQKQIFTHTHRKLSVGGDIGIILFVSVNMSGKRIFLMDETILMKF